MLDKPSIKDVIAFPKAQSGRDQMTGAPSKVSDLQLQELHLKIS
jgi:aspartyl-tRNA synthetase